VQTSRGSGMINLEILSGSGMGSGMGFRFSSYGIYLIVSQ